MLHQIMVFVDSRAVVAAGELIDTMSAMAGHHSDHVRSQVWPRVKLSMFKVTH